MEETRIPQWTLGDYLKKARTTAGLSTEQMAAELGVSRNTITNYESDTTRPKKAVLKVWAEVCGIDLTWLDSASGLHSVVSGWTRELAAHMPRGDKGGMFSTEAFPCELTDLLPERVVA